MTTIGERGQIVFFPDYTASNPYQALLYASISNAYEATAGTVHNALWEQSQAGLDETVVLHLHWEDVIYKHTAPGDRANAIEVFFQTLETFKERGGALVWTVHNKKPHDSADTELHQQVCRRIARLADAVHLHSAGAAQQVIEPFAIEPSLVHIIPHGNYRPVLPETVEKHAAREALGFPHDKRLILLFGRILGYKGANQLVETYRDLDHPNLLLEIAGVQKERVVTAWPDGQRIEGISTTDGFLSQGDLSLRIAAADFVILPYLDSLTSGSIVHAFSHGRPVIVPRLRAFEDLVSEANALLYKPKDPGSLRHALRRSAELSAATIDQLGRAALAEAERRDWHDIGKMFASLFAQPRSTSPQ